MSGGPPPPSQPRHPLLHLLLQLLLFLPGVTTAAPDLSQQVRRQQILRLEFIKENKNSTKKAIKKTRKNERKQKLDHEGDQENKKKLSVYY